MPVVVALEEIMALIGEGAAATAGSAAAMEEMVIASETASEVLAKTGTEAAAKTSKSTSQWQQVMKVAKSDEAKAAWEFVKSSMAAAALEEMTLKKIEAYTSHTAASREMVAELQELKGSTMLGDGVFENATTMLKNGVGEGEVVKSLRQIADIAHGDQKNMQQLALAFVHVREKGILMRKEFDEFKEAGFDPIKEMAEHWDRFGFKVKMTEGKLKELMEQGKLTAAQLSMAMEVATSAGGTHFGGLKDMEGTTLGKDKVLDAEVNTFKTTVGGWFTPIENAFTDFSVWVMQGVNRVTTDTVPEKVAHEKEGIQQKVKAVMELSEGSVSRTNMLSQLQQQYPAHFKNIDVSKTNNDQLWAILAKVTDEYNRQISVTEHKNSADKLNSESNKMQDLGQRAKVQADLIRRGSKVRVLTDSEYERLTRNNAYEKGDKIYRPEQLLDTYGDDFLNKASKLQPQVAAANNAVAYDNKYRQTDDVIKRVNELLHSPEERKKLWGADAGVKYKQLLKEAHRYDDMTKASGGIFDKTIQSYDLSKFNSLLYAQNVAAQTGKAPSGGGAETAAAITGGGRKVININLNQPMVAKQEFHVGNMKEALEISISEFRENYLRVLQGAVASL
jgi:hypothetical protein